MIKKFLDTWNTKGYKNYGTLCTWNLETETKYCRADRFKVTTLEGHVTFVIVTIFFFTVMGLPALKWQCGGVLC